MANNEHFDPSDSPQIFGYRARWGTILCLARVERAWKAGLVSQELWVGVYSRAHVVQGYTTMKKDKTRDGNCQGWLGARPCDRFVSLVVRRQ